MRTLRDSSSYCGKALRRVYDEEMRIIFPIPQKISTNAFYAGLHWAQRKAIADIYHKALLPFRNERITEFPAVISYEFSFKKRPLDSTNCAGMAKMLEDGMVAVGILPDDSYKFVRGSLLYTKKGNADEVQISTT